MTRILQVTTFYAPVVGGMETQVEDLSLKIDADPNFDVEIVATNSNRANQRLLKSQFRETYNGIRLTRVNTWFSFSEFHKFAPGIFWQLLRKNYDIIHVHGFRKIELVFAFWAAKLRRKKLVVSTHNPFTTSSRSWVHKLFILLVDIFFNYLFLRFVDQILCLTTAELEKIKKFGVNSSKLLVVPNAIDCEIYNTAADKDKQLELVERFQIPLEQEWKTIVLGVGRFAQRKGFQYLEQAVRDNTQSLFILVGGDGGYLSKLQVQYRDYPNVVIIDTFLPRHELVEFYKLADIFVLPSEHEPFGIVLIEAMAAGCAVLASKVGGPVDILQDGAYGLLLEPTQQFAWSKEILKLSQSESLLKRYQQLAAKRAENYSWATIYQQYREDIYRPN